MCPTIVSTGKTERVVAKQQGRERRESKGWHKTQRERETLVKLARYNRKRSNLLLITAKPLLHHPSRQRGGWRHSRLLPSDNSTEHTKSLIIYLSEAIHGTATMSTTAHTHTHTPQTVQTGAAFVLVQLTVYSKYTHPIGSSLFVLHKTPMLF